MRKIVTNFNVLFFFLMLFFGIGEVQAQENTTDEFQFLKTIDQVDIYYKQIFCDDNVEYLAIKAINKSSSPVNLDLQPIFISDNNTFNSTAAVSLTLTGDTQVIGDCNTSNLQVSIFEFFSQYDPTLMAFDLTKI